MKLTQTTETPVTEVLTMSEKELNSLPFGIIRINALGDILYYNNAQAVLAHREKLTTIGLNFFRDVAPCTDVKNFHGRFNDFVQLPQSKIEPFSFFFRFAWESKPVKVNITFVRRAGVTNEFYIVVQM